MVVIGRDRRRGHLRHPLTSSRSGWIRRCSCSGPGFAGGAIELRRRVFRTPSSARSSRAPAGQYVYLRDGLHPLAGFLYGWALLLVIESGAIAAVAITFATYALHLVGAPDAARVPLAIAAIAILSVINYLGVKRAAACSTCSSC
jgi:hypothetical protein